MTALSFVWVHPYSQNSRCDNMFTQDTVETILVNTNVYTHSTTNLCTTVDVCKTVVSSSVKPCCSI